MILLQDNLNNGVSNTDNTTASSTIPQTDESVTQQEELDTEVSQITTQQKNASVTQGSAETQGSFSRPMSRTSSITPVILLFNIFTKKHWFLGRNS